MKVTISSGHGKYVAGASRLIDEVTEARKVVDQVAEHLKDLGCLSDKYHENNAKNKNDNLNAIIGHHNTTSRNLDVSIHFNAFKKTDKNMGVEVCYKNNSEKELANKLCAEISKVSGLSNRMAKQRSNLGFLNYTNKPAILVEVCFVDSAADVQKYRKSFDAICRAIAETLVGKELPKPVATNKERCKLQVLFANNSTKYKVYQEFLKTLNLEVETVHGTSTKAVFVTFAPNSTKYVKVIDYLNKNKISFK